MDWDRFGKKCLPTITGKMLTLYIDFDYMLHHRLLSVHKIRHGKTYDLDRGSQSMGHSSLPAAYRHLLE